VPDDPGVSTRTPGPDEERGVLPQHGGENCTHRVRVLSVRAETTASGSTEQPIAQIAHLQRGFIADLTRELALRGGL